MRTFRRALTCFVAASAVIRFVAASSGATPATRPSAPFLGAYLHVPHVLGEARDAAARHEAIGKNLDRFAASGLRVVMPYATTTSGTAVYGSRIMPKREYPDWDPLAVLVAEAHKRKLDVWPVVCVISSGHERPEGILREHPEWALMDATGKKIGYLSPAHPDARRWIVSVLREIVANYQPEGILLDYMRFPNQVIRFDAASAARFTSENPGYATAGAAEQRMQLQAFKERTLTELARLISEELRRLKPDLRIGMYTWGPHVVQSHAVAQDWRTWAARGYVDMVSVSGYCYPENYGADYLNVFEKRMQDAVRIMKESGSPAELTLTLGVRTSHGRIDSSRAINDYLRIARRNGIRGTAIFTWSYLQPFLDDVVRQKYLSDRGPSPACGPAAVAHMTGEDFAGGAKDVFGATREGEQVNYVYARPTGRHATMRATFTLPRMPAEPLFVHLKARDDDGPGSCTVAIELNGRLLYEGPNNFPADRWATRRFAIPAGSLRRGENTIVIANRENAGQLGMPPWFMVASCTIAAGQYVLRPNPRKDFWVALPDEVRPLPEPLAAGQQPGFRIRGIKGWMWRPEQYLAEMPVLAKYRMNFLMNCYTSMCDVEHFRWGDAQVNRWWEDLPDSKRRAYENVARQCLKNGLHFCFSMNPNICTKRIVNYDSPNDVDLLWKHFSWMQGLGVKWFNISLDDITEGINASGQAKVVNEIFRRLRARDPDANMIFCPTYYWGDGTGKDQKPYLETLARELDKDVYVFWTGDAVVGRITRKAAETFRGIVNHRLFLWDNYPVNDARPTMHLGPVIERDADLCEVIDGYMSNPMCRQNELNRIPMLTCADYAYNPRAYDPLRSIGQAIAHQTDDPAGREVLRDVVEAYAGMLIYGKADTGFNSVREQYMRIANAPHSRYIAKAYIAYLEGLSERFKRAFPDRYHAEKKTLDDDIAALKEAHTAKYKDEAAEQDPR